MAARSLGLAIATMAVASEAFLLPPPDMYEYSVKPVPGHKTWAAVSPSSELLIVPCRGCKVDGFPAGGDANLLLNLTVGARPGSIDLNGENIYPLNPFYMTRNPKVSLIPVDASYTDLKTLGQSQYEDVISGWMLAAGIQHISDAGDEIITINIDITSIGSQHVSVPHVDFDVRKNPTGHMMVLSGRYAETQRGMARASACTNALCRLRELLEGRIHRIASSISTSRRRPCRKHKGMLMPSPRRFPEVRVPGYDNEEDMYRDVRSFDFQRPEYVTYEHHHRHHHHHFSIVRGFLRGFWHVVRDIGFPILIGLVAGLLTYSLGMIILSALVLLWIRVRCGRRRAAASGGVSLDECDALMAKQLDLEADAAARESFESAPPVYEHAPEYEEKEESKA